MDIKNFKKQYSPENKNERYVRSISITKAQHEFLDRYNINFSAFIRDMLEKMIEDEKKDKKESA